MSDVKDGSTVKIHYKGMFSDGTVFDRSGEGDPLEFTVGENKIISGLEEAVKTMSVGESKTVEVACEAAYGPHREELVGTVRRDRLPAEIEPETGQMLRVGQQGGQTLLVRVVEVNDEQITLDGNHPLAGRDLVFEVELVEVG